VEGAIDTIIGGKWRNFLKDPVMIFIYGSSMKNIRKAVAMSLIVGNSYIKGGLALGKVDELVELSGIKPMIAYKKYNKDTGMLENIDVRGMSDEKKAMYAVISERDVNKMAREIDKKIGDAFEESFKEEFGELIEFRQALKTIDQLNYLVFKSEINKKLAERGVQRITELPPKEIEGVYAELLEEGTYYGANNATGGVQDYVKLETVKNDDSKMRITVGMSEYQSKTAMKDLVTSKFMKEFVANVGAVGVTTIHDIDGSVMIEGHTEDVLNIYDALMLGVNAEINDRQTKQMNKTFTDINARHSILGKSVKKLLSNIDKINFTSLRAAESLGHYKDMESDLNRIFGYEGIDHVLDLINPDNPNSVFEILKKVNENRKAMEGQEVLANQYYATDLIEGVKVKLENVETVFDKDNEQEQMNKMRNVLGKFYENLVKGNENSMKEDRAKEFSKKIIGIINNNVSSIGSEYAEKLVNYLNKNYDKLKDC
jgi:hypothetical protein